VADVWAGVIGIFRDYGYRRLRTRARLKFLLADWGTEKFRQILEDDYLKRPLIDGPAPAQPPQQWRDHVGVHRQKDGLFYVGFAPRVGRVDGPTLTRIAALAEEHGSGRVRTTVEQKMIVLDVPEDRVDSLAAGLEALDLRVKPSPFRRGTMACTGIEFCKLAIVETKQRGATLIDELEQRLPDFDEPITINVNGCPNACARIQVADIGLKGQLVLDQDGNQVEGFQVHLGGALGLEAGFGRKVRGLKVTSAELPDYVERVLDRFQKEREEGERFATWAARASEEALS
jgi:sulfite reductase (ferredoxin)